MTLSTTWTRYRSMGLYSQHYGAGQRSIKSSWLSSVIQAIWGHSWIWDPISKIIYLIWINKWENILRIHVNYYLKSSWMKTEKSFYRNFFLVATYMEINRSPNLASTYNSFVYHGSQDSIQVQCSTRRRTKTAYTHVITTCFSQVLRSEFSQMWSE